MSVSRRKLLAGIALGLPLAACGANPFTIDPSSVNIIDAVSRLAKGFCGLLPTADTISQIIVALALPSGAPAQQIASQVAHAFCDHVAPVVASRRALRRGVAADGRIVLDYGQVVINGKAVNIVVYAP